MNIAGDLLHSLLHGHGTYVMAFDEPVGGTGWNNSVKGSEGIVNMVKPSGTEPA